MSLLRRIKGASRKIKEEINAWEISLNLAMSLNKNKLAAAGLILLSGVLAILAFSWNVSEVPQFEQQLVLSDASGKAVSETHAFRGRRSRGSGKGEYLSYGKKF